MNRLVLLAFALPCLAAAQQTSTQLSPAPPLTRPPAPILQNLLPKDSALLQRQFFYYHYAVTNWMAALKSGKTAAIADDLDNKVAANFSLTRAGYQQLEAVTTAVARELIAIDQQQNAHANARAYYEQPPLPAMLRQFEAQRQDAVTRGAAKLQSLPPAVWSATQGYINGAFRNGIRVK